MGPVWSVMLQDRVCDLKLLTRVGTVKKIIIQNELMYWVAVLPAGEGLLIALVFSVAAGFSGLPGECSLLTERSRVPISRAVSHAARIQ